MYTLIGSPTSRAFRVLWLLEELGLDYDLQKTQPRSETVLAHNPAGKIPVLLEDGEAITDSVAIMQYLADKHGGFTHPPGTLQRARQDAVTQLLCDEFDAPLWCDTRNRFINPEDHRAPAIRDVLLWEFPRAVTGLETRLGDQDYLAGDVPTVADILAVHCLNWAQISKFPVESEALQSYQTRMRARPAYLRVSAMRKQANAG